MSVVGPVDGVVPDRGLVLSRSRRIDCCYRHKPGTEGARLRLYKDEAKEEEEEEEHFSALFGHSWSFFCLLIIPRVELIFSTSF